VFVAGATDGIFGGPPFGWIDAWVARYDECGWRSYCTSGTTSHGCVPTIDATGTPSASATNGFVVAVDSVEGGVPGLLFYGIDNSGWVPHPFAPGSSSWLCIQAPIQRTSVTSAGGTHGACDGRLTLDWNAYRATHTTALGQPFYVGSEVRIQGWFRDPGGPSTTSTSDALLVHLFP
jgi:hypothetical protein